MPQMAPISWLLLFLIFTLALTLFCMMNYFNYMKSPSKSKLIKNMSTNQMNWKW